MSSVIKRKTSSATPVVSTSAYATGDVIGSKLTISNAARIDGGTGTIESVVVHSKSLQTALFDVVFFHADPSASTFTDNAALAVAAADFAKVCGIVNFAAANWTALGTPSQAEKHRLTIPFDLTTGKDLYAAIVSRGTPTLASTSDIQIEVYVTQN